MLLALLLAVASVAAAGSEEVQIVVVPPRGCLRLQVGSELPEVAAYEVQTSVTWLNETDASTMDPTGFISFFAEVFFGESDVASSGLRECGPFQVFQTLQRRPAEFAIEQDTHDNNCSAAFASAEAVVPVAPLTWQSYAVCSGIDWSLINVVSGQLLPRWHPVPPLDTFIIFDNQCDDEVTLNVTLKLASVGEDVQYCEELKGVSAGNNWAAWVRLVLTVSFILAMVTLFAICTKCFSCCCCNGLALTRGLFRGWKAVCSSLGCGWMLEPEAVGMHHHSVAPHLVFWSFGFIGLSVSMVVRIPNFKRPDVLSVDLHVSRAWSVYVAENDVQALVFVILSAVQYIGVGAGALVLNYLDPGRERWLLNKAVLAASLLLVSMTSATVTMVDLLRYYDLWTEKAAFLVLLSSVLLLMCGTIVSFVRALVSIILQRRRAGGVARVEQQPQAETGAVTESRATVNSTSSQLTMPTPVSMVAAAPVATGAEAGGQPAQDTGPLGEGRETAEQHHPQDEDAVLMAPGLGERGDEVPEAACPVGAGSEGAGQDEAAAQGSGYWVPEAEAATEAAAVPGWAGVGLRPVRMSVQGRAQALRDRLQRAWESIREDSEFRYSPLFLAAAVVAGVVLVGSYLWAFYYISYWIECTQEASECVDGMQTWIRRNALNVPEGQEETLLERLRLACDSVNGSLPVGAGQVGAAMNVNTEAALELCEQAQGSQESSTVALEQLIGASQLSLKVGARASFTIGFLMGVYTIVHSVWAYKQAVLALREAQAAPGGLTGKGTDGASTQTGPLGKHLLNDINTSELGTSMYFTGLIVSTCFCQLWLVGFVLTVFLGGLLHPMWWLYVRNTSSYWIGLVGIIIWHVALQRYVNRRIVEGAHIKYPLRFLFLYLLFSSAYCAVALLLAIRRFVVLMLTTLVSLSRLDECIFTVVRSQDIGYTSFCAMTLLGHTMDTIEAEVKSTNAVGSSGDALPESHVDASASTVVGHGSIAQKPDLERLAGGGP